MCNLTLLLKPASQKITQLWYKRCIVKGIFGMSHIDKTTCDFKDNLYI